MSDTAAKRRVSTVGNEGLGMMLARPSIAVACTALVVIATHADAKTAKPKPVPPPSCRPLVTDPAGDANGVNPGPPVPATHAGASVDALDILSIDLGTGKTTMVWLLRVKKLAATSPNAPTGMFWSVHFTIRKTTFTLAAHSNPVSGITYDLSYATANGGGRLTGPLVGTLDTVHSEIRFVLPTATIATQERAPLSAKITGIVADTGQEAGASPVSAHNTVDWTTTDGEYMPGKARRCT